MVRSPAGYKTYVKKNIPGLNLPRRTKSRVKQRNLSLKPELNVEVGTEYVNNGLLLPNNNEKRNLENLASYSGIDEEFNFDPTTSRTLNELEPASEEMLYRRSKITEQESTLLLTAFIMRHKLTKDGANELLTLVNLFLPDDVTISRSFHILKKKMEYNYESTSFHYYCSKCDEYLGLQFGDRCNSCSMELEKSLLNRSGSFFLTFDIKSQLECMLQKPAITEELARRLKNRTKAESGLRTDIMDGQAYKSLDLEEYDISCAFNTDGVPVFKSSKFSIWPILYSVNELTYPTRRASTLIAGLWFGNSKPNFDSFLGAFVKNANRIFEVRVDWNVNGRTISSRVVFPIIVTDSVARCQCQGLKQFNGAYGCTWCLASGKMLKLGENSQKWVYPSSCVGSQERTKSNFMGHLKCYKQMLTENDCREANGYFGIKSASQLLLLKKFDIVSGFTFDCMHTAFLGISRTFTNHWLDSRNSNQRFYCGTKSSLIDDRLLKFSVPFEFDRTLRSIQNVKFWKANEWRNWTYISVHIMSGILPDCYVTHFSKFVTGIMLLTGEQISATDICKAGKLLNEFSIGIETLYGPEFCSYNAHILTHAAECVSNWGPLWAYSAFQFENYNGVLLNLFNGTQHIELQIANRITEMVEIESSSGKMTRDGQVSKLFTQLIRHRKLHSKIITVGKNIALLGAGKQYLLSDEENKEIHSRLNLATKSAQTYKSCILGSVSYNTLEAVSSKRCNCVFEVNGQTYVIRKLLRITTINNVEVGLCLGSRLKLRQNKLLQFCSNVLDISNATHLFKLDEITSKFLCYFGEGNILQTIVKIPNCKESE